LAQLPRQPYYSAIGSYALKAPAYYAWRKFAHQLALEVLKEFLAPDVNDAGRVVRVSEFRNRDVPDGYVGLQAVLSFMTAYALNIYGQVIPNTNLMRLIAEIRQKEAHREGAIISQVAQGGLTKTQSHYLLALTDVSQDEEGNRLVRTIADELRHTILREVPLSRNVGDTPDQAFARIKNKVPEFRYEHYGLDTPGGEQLRGRYGEALELAKSAQIVRFRKLLQAWTQQTLNGESSDPRIARGGKIGYVRAFYAELVETFDYFIGFLKKVRFERNQSLQLAVKTKEAARSALIKYEQIRSKKLWFAFWDDYVHPDAHRAQEDYLLAEQRDIDVRKDDILLDV
jgi:hypothetical protein